ncbi:uncharacterized protein TNCV_3504331 [Trichonephila clavipes]|uniref:Uncharacterized protein n=1 Tax=Trichonephila clavipes TaxID=2585209 RepID=A0A8X6S8R6_TRICX|nr:uncharacterized protein TNCV_3504331 [Trichonephila clavipes]
MTSSVIDFEGFQLSSELFVVKELAVCAVNDDTFRGRWLFKPPHSFDQLPKPKQCTYSWGLEKKKFFHFLTGRKILNLDDFECPKVNDLPSSDVMCPFSHENFNHCAVYKARVYGKFLGTV